MRSQVKKSDVMMVVTMMQSVASVEDIEGTSESWFFEEPVEVPIEKEIRVMRCAVADEQKPQENTELGDHHQRE